MKFTTTSILCLAFLIVRCNTQPKSCNGDHNVYADNIDTAKKYSNCITILDLTIPNRTYHLPSLTFLKRSMSIDITDTVGADWKQLLDRISEIDSIHSLGLHGNMHQRTLPLRLNKKNTLRELQIWFPIDILPKAIFEMKNLEWLSIWNISQPDSFFDYIAKLPKLKRLDIKDYSFDSLPSAIAQLHNLEYLSLGGKKLRYIPRDIIRIKRLNHLNLIGTPLAESELVYFRKHKHYNQLRIITDSLPHCSIVLRTIYHPMPNRGEGN